MKNSVKMIISSVVVIAILFVMVNYAFATSALTPSSNLSAGSAEVPNETDDTNTNTNTNSNGRVIISNTNSSSSNNTSRVNVVNNTNTNRNSNLPATGQEDIFVVGGMLVVLLGVAGYTYYKMKNANM